MNKNSSVENQVGQESVTENLKYIRSIVEKTYNPLRPQTHVLVVWGLISIFVYTAVFFLVKLKLFTWIYPVYILSMVTGIGYTSLTVFMVNKREKRSGIIPQLPEKITLIWFMMTFFGFVFSIIGLFNDFFGGPGFLWALLLSFTLGVTGILHSKEWLLGSIVIFTGMLTAFFIKDYAYIILGLATGAGLIIPAIIAQKNYRKVEKENA